MTRHQKKEIGLIVVTLTYSALLFWWLAAGVSLFLNNPYLVAAFLVSSFVWAALTVLALGLATGKISRLALTLGIPLLVVIAGRAHVGALGAALLFVLPLASAQRHLIREIQNRVSYHTTQIFSAGTRLVLIGLIIAMAGLLSAPLSRKFRADGFQVPQQFIELALEPATAVINNFLPGYAADRTIDQLLKSKLQAEADSLPPDTAIPPGELDSLHRNLTRSYGLPVSGQETLPTLVTAYVNKSLTNLTQSAPLLAALLTIAAFLLVARLIIPILLWPTLGVISLLVYLAQRANFVYLLTSQETVERLQL